MSSRARERLEQASRESGLTMTEVLETCVAMHALSIPKLAESVRKEMFDLIASQFVNDKKKKFLFVGLAAERSKVP